MTTEEEFHAALDRDPGNGFLRLLLADHLDDNAGTVECPACGGCGHESAYCTTACPGCCPGCHGTGTVSDGRRERAAGFRTLGELGHYPYRGARGHSVWFDRAAYIFDVPRVAFRPSHLRAEWFRLIPRPGGARGPTRLVRFRTRREADDAAALAWSTLPADVQARILAGVTA